MNSCKITYIYGLYEVGKENEIRYVGKTDNPQKRIRDHRNDNRVTSHKSCWVKSILSKGGDINIKVLKVVSQDSWKDKEIEVIKEYRNKFKLVNLTDGGDGTMNNIYNKSFDECRDWLKFNKPEWVKGLKEYKQWSKMKDFPDFLPKAPNRVFIDWTYWGDYLGTGNIHTKNRKDIYLSYEEAKKYLKENYNFKSSVDFKNAKFPNFIPKKPFNIYTCWSGWPAFLDYEPYKRTNCEYLTYDEARKWISKNLSFITSKDYREMSKSNKLPLFLPKKPEKYYQDFSWSYYLFENGRKKHNSFYMKYEECIKIVHELNLKTNLEWRKWCKNKPKEFIRVPSAPDKVYRKEWVSWFEWLGK